MLAGGVEACIGPLAMTGFSRARALSTKFNDNPENASRPFDKDRDGFVMGEGAGILVLESEQHARDRGARIYCRLSGFGSSGDADHITTAREDGAGARAAMEAAMSEAGVGAGDQVWSVNAHATSTPLGDQAEAGAIASVLHGSEAGAIASVLHGSRAMVTSNKGSIGHLLGAAGAVEAVFSVLSVCQGIVPPTINIDNLDTNIENLNLNIVKGTKVCDTSTKRRILLKNSFGFGGTNA